MIHGQQDTCKRYERWENAATSTDNDWFMEPAIGFPLPLLWGRLRGFGQFGWVRQLPFIAHVAYVSSTESMLLEYNMLWTKGQNDLRGGLAKRHART